MAYAGRNDNRLALADYATWRRLDPDAPPETGAPAKATWQRGSDARR
jgi:hypothetical protein